MKFVRITLIAAGIILLLFLGAVFRPSSLRSKADVKAALITPESKFLQWRGGEIHYTDEGNGFPVVMIHGFSGSHKNFARLASLLKNDFRIIRLDLPGFGLSDFPTLRKGETSLDVYKDYIGFMINSLQLDSFYLIGNSMGGMLAWVTAHDYPEKVTKLVLCASAGYELEKVARHAVGFVKNPVTRLLIKPGVPEFVSRRAAERCWFDDTRINPVAVNETNLMWNRMGNIDAALTLGAATEFPDTAWIKEIKCPTMIVWGKQDEIVPFAHAAKFHRDIPNNILVEFDSCGHLPMIEQAEKFRLNFIAFLKE